MITQHASLLLPCHYKIVIAYDGTAYHGWQVQKHCSSVAGTLQQVFEGVFKHECYIIGASRTDAGVHALGQVALLCTTLELDAARLQKAWQEHLPIDIFIRACSRVDHDFHPQRLVRDKTYHYYFSLQRPLPGVARYVWHDYKIRDITYLQENLKVFVGRHDFRSFCTGDERENTTRCIKSIELDTIERYSLCRIAITGDGFLRYMIRRIVGACLLTARDKGGRKILENVLHEKNPRQELLTAPPHGLVLRKISYEEND